MALQPKKENLPAIPKRPSVLSKQAAPLSALNASQTLEQWLNQESTVRDQVNVTDPHIVPVNSGKRRSSTSTIASLLTKTSTVYQVQLNQMPPVERSYKDFVLLREALVKNFPASCPPPLPKSMNALAPRDPFLRRRVRQLGLFLQVVMDNPFFRNDMVLDDFCTNPLEFDLSRVVSNGEGRARWQQAIAEAPRPKDSVQMIAVLKSELEACKRAMEKLKTACKQEAAKMAILAQAKSEVALAFGDWLDMERNLTTPLAGGVPIDISDGTHHEELSLPDALEPARLRTADHAVFLQGHEDEFEQSVLDSLRFEIQYLCVWLEHLNETQWMVNRHVKAVETLAQAEEAVIKNPGNGPMILRLREAKQVATDAKAAAVLYEKGLCIELVRLRQGRILRACSLNESVHCLHVDGANFVRSVWFQEPPQPSEKKSLAGGAEPPKAALPPADQVPKPDPQVEAHKQVLQAAQSVLSMVEKREAKNIVTADEQQREIEDRQWGFVLGVVVAQSCFALSFWLRGAFVASLPAWACVVLTMMVAKVVEMAHELPSPSGVS